jgi:hypothetical protein
VLSLKKLFSMPKLRVPFPVEDAPNYNPDEPYADKVALVDHRQYLLGQYFVLEARARVRKCTCYRSLACCSEAWRCRGAWPSLSPTAGSEGHDEGMLCHAWRGSRNRMQRNCWEIHGSCEGAPTAARAARIAARGLKRWDAGKRDRCCLDTLSFAFLRPCSAVVCVSAYLNCCCCCCCLCVLHWKRAASVEHDILRHVLDR